MAKYKRKISTIDVNGMSIEDIMSIDLETFNKLSESDLRRLTSRLVSAGNKRVRALEKAGLITPALKGLGTDTRFTTKVDKNLSHAQKRNKLAQEFGRVRNFLTLKTSSIRGFNKFSKEQDKVLMKELNFTRDDLESVNKSKAFEILHKLQQSGYIPVGHDESSSLASKHARNFIFQSMLDNPELDEESIMRMTKEDYEDIYEETEESEI